jgi:UDP-N-acetylmuramate dehydrogenase
MPRLLERTASLLEGIDAQVELDADIGSRTWFHVGGRADALVSPRSVEALVTIAGRCHESGTPLRVLGSGANLLIADDGVDGVVVHLDAACFQKTEVADDGAAPIRAWAGVDLMKLVQDCARLGRDGLAHLAGVPAMVGGAVTMNAGGAFGDTAQAVVRVGLLASDGTRLEIEARDVGFGYRHTRLPSGVILYADLALTPGDPIAIRARVKEIFAYKSASQPMADRSAGCMFRNPTDPATGQRTSAGKLIDQAGLKGHAVGGAYVSQVHGNFIALREGGSASDVLALVRAVQQRVLDRTGINLEREVVVWSRQGEIP